MKGYGVKETGTNDKVDENTLFMIGSNTKALRQQHWPCWMQIKKLSLDDKVQKWLPDFKFYDPWVAKEANIRDLLCHRLGFETFQGDFMYFDSDLISTAGKRKNGKAKTACIVSAVNGVIPMLLLMTAGEIIPKVNGKTWADFITEKIFKPLGMNNSLALSKDIKTASNKCFSAYSSNG